MSQASDAMKMAAETGMTLKEAWAKVKAQSPSEEVAPEAEERGEHALASMKAKEEGGW